MAVKVSRGGVEVVLDDRRLKRLLGDRRLESMKEPLHIVRGRIEGDFRRRFETAGAHLGTKWKPLAPATVRSRLRKRGGNKGGVDRPLWDTGRLKQSLQRVGPESISVVSDTELVRGTAVPYASAHQPTRPIVTEEMKQAAGEYAIEEIGKYVKEVLGAE
jgi:hypothetical protein